MLIPESVPKEPTLGQAPDPFAVIRGAVLLFVAAIIINKVYYSGTTKAKRRRGRLAKKLRKAAGIKGKRPFKRKASA